MHDKFLWLIKHFVLSHEKVIEVDDKMAVDMASKTVKAIVNDRKRNTSLKKTFARYGEKRDGQQVMTLTQFMGMLKSAEILPDDKQLLSVDGLWRFSELARLEGVNRETGGQSIAFVYEVVQSRRAANWRNELDG